MASTLTAATLKVRISESCTLNNKDHGAIHTKTISNINMITKRQFNIAATSTITVAELASDPSGTMKYDSDLVKYIRITNLDDTTGLLVTYEDTSTSNACIEIPAGASHILFSTSIAGDASGSAAITAVNAMNKIYIRNNAGSSTDCEIFVAQAAS